MRALEGVSLPDAEGRYAVTPEYRITVGELAATLAAFATCATAWSAPTSPTR